jgi:hypothetical protein
MMENIAPYAIRRQIADALGLLLLMALIFPPIFIAADWLRYGGL